MAKYHYEIIDSNGYTHRNWVFAESDYDFWIAISLVINRVINTDSRKAKTVTLVEVTQ